MQYKHFHSSKLIDKLVKIISALDHLRSTISEYHSDISANNILQALCNNYPLRNDEDDDDDEDDEW